MEDLYNFLIELDKLKSVYRDTYISDLSRNENSAEHSWHLAIGILLLKDELNLDIDLIKAVKMALVHDICEIGAGDISIYDKERSKKIIEERKYIKNLSLTSVKFASEIEQLWEEYETQSTKESHWVKIVDRLLPFLLNLATKGKTWKEQGTTKNQVKEVTKVIEKKAPEVYEWILIHIKKAVELGWLIDAE